MRAVFLLVCLTILGSASTPFAQGDPIDCSAPRLGVSVAAMCDVLGRITDATVLRRFSIEDGSTQTYSVEDFKDDLIGGISVERRVEADDSDFVHLSFASRAVCSLDGDRVVECIGSIPQRNNGLSCRREIIAARDGPSTVMALLVCPVVTAWGTGISAGGDVYFIDDHPGRYVGYFPTFDVGSNPINNVEFQITAKDRLSADATGYGVILDRCISIDSRGAVATRCEKYSLHPNGSVKPLQETSTFNTTLLTAYGGIVDAEP